MTVNANVHRPADTLAPRRVRVADKGLAEVLAGTRTLLFDGGMGTMLQEAGLAA